MYHWSAAPPAHPASFSRPIQGGCFPVPPGRPSSICSTHVLGSSPYIFSPSPSEARTSAAIALCALGAPQGKPVAVSEPLQTGAGAHGPHLAFRPTLYAEVQQRALRQHLYHRGAPGSHEFPRFLIYPAAIAPAVPISNGRTSQHMAPVKVVLKHEKTAQHSSLQTAISVVGSTPSQVHRHKRKYSSETDVDTHLLRERKVVCVRAAPGRLIHATSSNNAGSRSSNKASNKPPKKTSGAQPPTQMSDLVKACDAWNALLSLLPQGRHEVKWLPPHDAFMHTISQGICPSEAFKLKQMYATCHTERARGGGREQCRELLDFIRVIGTSFVNSIKQSFAHEERVRWHPALTLTRAPLPFFRTTPRGMYTERVTRAPA